LFRYRLCAFDERVMLEAHARQAARLSSRPVYVLRELVDLLRRERIVLPGYTILQNMVRGALVFERESHFVFDILLNNATDILPAIHSTDTHGTNHVNFALLHPFGYRFAPRYRNVKRQVKTGLVGFRHPTYYDKDWPIKPNRRVREGLILSEEANIEQILLSLALKSTTQSVIVGKLSAYRLDDCRRQADAGCRWGDRELFAPLFHRMSGAHGGRESGGIPLRRMARQGTDRASSVSPTVVAVTHAVPQGPRPYPGEARTQHESGDPTGLVQA
jgi:hypothetical protein